MEPLLIAVGAVGVLVGLAGVVLPVLPGSLIVWLATAGTLLLHRADGVAWTLTVVLALLGVVGSIAQVALPARTGVKDVPASSTLWALAGAVVGFFVLPALGFVVGAMAGLLVGERQRLGDWAPAWSSALRLARSYGIGVLVDLVLAIAMVLVWVAAILWWA